jgi:hypothetical protein
MCSSCWLTCTRAPFTAVIDLAGTCPFASNKKHAENIGKQYCTPLPSEAVLEYPPLLYLIHLTPVPTCRIHNLQKKNRETVIYYSCCLSCTRAPITAVLDTPCTCIFLQNPKFADRISETVIYYSCCLSCTRAPFTSVLD